MTPSPYPRPRLRLRPKEPRLRHIHTIPQHLEPKQMPRRTNPHTLHTPHHATRAHVLPPSVAVAFHTLSVQHASRVSRGNLRIHAGLDHRLGAPACARDGPSSPRAPPRNPTATGEGGSSRRGAKVLGAYIRNPGLVLRVWLCLYCVYGYCDGSGGSRDEGVVGGGGVSGAGVVVGVGSATV